MGLARDGRGWMARVRSAVNIIGGICDDGAGCTGTLQVRSNSQQLWIPMLLARSAAASGSRTCALSTTRSSEPALSRAPPPLPLAAGHRGPLLTRRLSRTLAGTLAGKLLSLALLSLLLCSTPSSPPTRLRRTCACSSTARPCSSVCIESWRRRCSSQAVSKPRPVWPASAA